MAGVRHRKNPKWWLGAINFLKIGPFKGCPGARGPSNLSWRHLANRLIINYLADLASRPLRAGAYSVGGEGRDYIFLNSRNAQIRKDLNIFGKNLYLVSPFSFLSELLS